jgi:hypothetical protein
MPTGKIMVEESYYIIAMEVTNESSLVLIKLISI